MSYSQVLSDAIKEASIIYKISEKEIVTKQIQNAERKRFLYQTSYKRSWSQLSTVDIARRYIITKIYHKAINPASQKKIGKALGCSQSFVRIVKNEIAVEKELLNELNF